MRTLKWCLKNCMGGRGSSEGGKVCSGGFGEMMAVEVARAWQAGRQGSIEGVEANMTRRQGKVGRGRARRGQEGTETRPSNW